MSTATAPQRQTEDPGQTDFAMPAVSLLDRVLVSSTMPFKNPLPGFVVGNYPDSIDVLLFSAGGVTPYEDCIHVDDPRLQSDPGIINRFEYRGVFKMADSEQTARELAGHVSAFAERVSSLEATQAEHSKQITTLLRGGAKAGAKAKSSPANEGDR